jgi:tetratricopeptide (TPR) repeat protein
MSIEGSLADVGLADICQLLALGRKTGCLTVTDRSNFGYLYFEKGRVIHAMVLSRPVRLGEVLVKNGAITPEQLTEAMVSQAHAPSNRLGQILLERGDISEEDLKRFITIQVEEAVYYLFTWEQGQFHFDPDTSPDEEDSIQVSLNMDSLLMEGARRVDEWSVIEKKIPSLDVIFALERDPADSDEEVELSPAQEKVIALMDGERSVHDLVEESGLVEFDVAKAVYGLIQAGFVRRVGKRALAGEGEGAATEVRAVHHQQLAEAFYRAGMLDDAARELEAAVDLDPKNTGARGRLAVVRLKSGDLEGAVRDLEIMEGAGAKGQAMLTNKAVALQRAGRFEEALVAVDGAERAAPGDPRVLLTRGIIELKAKDPAAAWKTFEAYRTSLGDETPPAVYFAYAILAAGMIGEFPLALGLGREGLAAHPDHPAILVNMGSVLDRGDETDAARSLFERAASLIPCPPQAEKNLGDLAYRGGDHERARGHYEKAIKLSPNLGDDVYLKLGNLAYNDGDTDWAQRLWGRARELNPQNEVVKTNLELLASLD